MGEMSREMQMSIAALSTFPGFRFSPNDEELISYYLKKKLQGLDNRVDVIPEIEICRHEPWDLPAKAAIQSDNEWFFFSPRGRKYPNGLQSKRATESGYWKATGKERNVKSGSNLIGTKRTLVFHTGRAPRGERTEWIMHEYHMSGTTQDSLVVCRLRKNNEFHLNDPSRKGSINRRRLSGGNGGPFASSDGGIGQATLLEGVKLLDCCSKECSSSYNSHSVEQIDSESESDPTLKNEFSQHNSSSQQQDCDDEDDCFAAIMKDDIIKLDESSPTVAPDWLPMVSGKSEAERKSKELVQSVVSNVLPSQGTANRRIRLNRQKVENYLAKPPEASDVLNGKYPTKKVNGLHIMWSPNCLMRIFPGAIDRGFISIFFIMLTLLFLFLCLLGGFKQFKKMAYAFFF